MGQYYVCVCVLCMCSYKYHHCYYAHVPDLNMFTQGWDAAITQTSGDLFCEGDRR